MRIGKKRAHRVYPHPLLEHRNFLFLPTFLEGTSFLINLFHLKCPSSKWGISGHLCTLCSPTGLSLSCHRHCILNPCYWDWQPGGWGSAPPAVYSSGSASFGLFSGNFPYFLLNSGKLPRGYL